MPPYTGKDLIQSIHDKDLKKLAAVVKSGVDVTYATQRGLSALHLAAFNHDKDIVIHLLEDYPQCIKSGKLLDKKKGFNALHYWCDNGGDNEGFDKLIHAGFDYKIKTSDGQTSLDLARKTGNKDLVKHIEGIQTGPSVVKSTWTELHQCAVGGNAFDCLNLIENNKGADVMKVSTCPQQTLPPLITPIEVALHTDNLKVLEVLSWYTDYQVTQKCLGMNFSKDSKKILRKGIEMKLCEELKKYSDDYVKFGKIDGDESVVCVVFSTRMTHGTEKKKAGYRILHRNPLFCERNGRDEGRDALYHCHKHNYLLSETDRISIDKAVTKCENLWNKHSNIRGIISSPVKCEKGKFLRKACVVILCLFKGFIPENEDSFPKIILVDGVSIPVDVRDGWFKLVGSDSPLGTHVPLNMGCNIGTDDGTSRFGTLGPFVDANGDTAFLACAHVMFSEAECSKKTRIASSGPESHMAHNEGGRRVDEGSNHQGDSYQSQSSGRIAIQPADGPKENSSDPKTCECGRVLMWDYAIENDPSIDIAVVRITKEDRKPQSGRFTAYDIRQLKMAGFGEEEPTFDTGRLGKPSPVENEGDKAQPVPTSDGQQQPDGKEKDKPDPRNNIVIFGSSSGPTSGKYGGKAQFTTKTCGKTKPYEKYRGMYYIENSQCDETHCKLPPLAISGDSGAGVFQRMDDNSLVCIGVLVAVDNTGSALVIPIEPILKHFNLKLKCFKPVH